MTDRHKSSTTLSVRVPYELKERIDILAQKSLKNRQQYLLNALTKIAFKHIHNPITGNDYPVQPLTQNTKPPKVSWIGKKLPPIRSK